MSEFVSYNPQIRLVKLAPPGYPNTQDSIFQLKIMPPTPTDQVPKGNVVVQNLYLSIDATMRIWISGARSYMQPMKAGDLMKGLGVAEVLYAPEGSTLKKGAIVLGLTNWEKYSVLAQKTLTPLPKSNAVYNYLGVFGISGLTAYFGLMDVGKVKKGQTVVVSAAAGAVGEIVVQLAKVCECRVIGIAGGKEKCDYVKSIGADECVDYKQQNWKQSLAAALKQGFDVYYDNVGGQTLDTVLMSTRDNARIVLSGAISTYNQLGSEPYRLKNYSRLIIKRATMQGFLYFDYAPKFKEAITLLQKYAFEGRIKHRVDMRNGLDEAPSALKSLLNGTNKGKVIVQVSLSQSAKL